MDFNAIYWYYMYIKAKEAYEKLYDLPSVRFDKKLELLGLREYPRE